MTAIKSFQKSIPEYGAHSLNTLVDQFMKAFINRIIQLQMKTAFEQMLLMPLKS
ncbi:hypothetical protein [Lentilactobacillus kefiri]|uniref:hypothetical protein n=1 Tax=Lentilactobacillus kefiri TaxID=33962 RepID=UPI001CDD6A22|nr:hypothetical protein [Lentilactobacillus kefiri]